MFLVARTAHETGKTALMAAKRYKPRLSSIVRKGTVNGQDRLVQSGRDKRAIAKKSRYGQFLMRSEWAQAEFDYLCFFHAAGVPVPYPVQIHGTEILMEWIGDAEGTSATRLVDATIDQATATALHHELTEAMVTMARLGYAHGDLSPYNILLHEGRPIIIDLPQVVDIAKNPLGAELLERDCRNVSAYFLKQGVMESDPEALFATCLSMAWS